MIKTIQLLKDSFTTYKHNFKNIFWMTWPIALLTIIGQYYSLRSTEIVKTGNYNLSFLALITIIYIVCVLVTGLFLGPALNRSIQKNEDNGNFDVKEGYSFQKKNIWKWIMVNIWGTLYILWRFLPYMIVSAILFISAFVYKNPVFLSTAIILGSLILLIGVILNISRFVFYKAIFFSKDIKPRDAVRESVKFGINKNWEVWKIIFGIIIVVIIVQVVLEIINNVSGSSFTGLVIGSTITALFSMPYLLVLVSKGYNKIKGSATAQ